MSAVDDFLRKLLKSGLLPRDELQSTLRTLPKPQRDEPSAIGAHLVQSGKLTPFQAHKLSQGITFGLVLGSYHILTPLGRGGMGTVYLARDTRTQAHVALKILPPRVARTEERLLARFQREMDLSQKVKHPHLASAADVGIYQNVHYIAMEYIPGQTLYRLIAAKGVMPVARVAHLFGEVATAIAHAHSQGVIHRDLKPSNIMVTPHDHARVLDLGLAFTEGEEVEDKEVVGGRGYIVGSIDYMPPEQTRDPTSVDNRADLYAIGCCMYYALTGQPPFSFGTVYDKVKAHRHEPPPSIRATNRDVSEAFADLVHKLMAKRPEDRFGSAIELAYALESWRPHDVLPLDTPEDEEFKRAVKDVVESWVPLEPSKEAAQAAEDAVLFHVEVVEEASADEPLAGSIFREVDRLPPYVWLFLIVGAWLALLSLCVIGSCLFMLFKQ